MRKETIIKTALTRRDDTQRLEKELKKVKEYRISHRDKEFTIYIDNNAMYLYPKEEGKAHADLSGRGTITCLFSRAYVSSNPKKLKRDFPNWEEALSYALDYLSIDCKTRSLSPSQDCFIASTHNKDQKFVAYKDVAIFIPESSQQGYVIKINHTNSNLEPEISRFILPEPSIDTIADFRLGEAANSVCCKPDRENLKISTLSKENYWSALHLYDNEKVLQQTLGFLLNPIGVEGALEIPALANKEWSKLGILSLLGNHQSHPQFYEVNQCLDAQNKPQTFVIPIASRHRGRSAMITRYRPNLFGEEKTQIKDFLRALQKQLSGLAYSTKVKDVLG